MVNLLFPLFLTFQQLPVGRVRREIMGRTAGQRQHKDSQSQRRYRSFLMAGDAAGSEASV